MNDKYKNDLVAIVKNPLNGNGLRFLSIPELDDINHLIRAGKIYNTSGEKESLTLEAGLIDEEGSYCVRIESGIVWLLPSLLIRMKTDGNVFNPDSGPEKIKMGVRHFYESFGWQQTKEGLYADGARFEDHRAFVKEYTKRCNQRIMDYLNPSGKYFLDAGSGPIQHDDYLEYSAKFSYRLCVDLSTTALQEARKKLGERGIYILADLSHLPIRDHCISSAISINALYHVPKSEQMTVMKELYRVLMRKGKAVVVYSNGRMSTLMSLLSFPVKLAVKIKAILRKSGLAGDGGVQELYFFAYPLGNFGYKTLGFDVGIRVWRFLSVPVMKMYFHRMLFGKRLLRFIFRLEQKYPSFLGKIGEYPLLCFEKK